MEPSAISAIVSAGISAAYAATVANKSAASPELRWDWSTIDPSELHFPPGFLWGAATAAHQVEGNNENNTWSRWEKETDAKGKPRTHNGDQAGLACDHWNRYPEDLRRARTDLGLNSYRFSVEWSRIEPSPGEISQEALDHYSRKIDTLLELGITPMVTLHHFSDPLWFADQGGFERKENIPLFVSFCERVFKRLGDRVRLWCTHNEPGPYCTMGWGLGVFPPGKKNYQLMGQVLANVLRSHQQVHQAIHAMPGGDKAQVGLVKNIFQMDPYHRWNLLHWVFTDILNGVYNDSILHAMETGHFKLRVPFLARVEEEITGLPESLDFVGLNYYSHLLMKLLMKREPPFDVLKRKGDIVNDMPYVTYPEGFYRALMRMKRFGKPIYVTENGIADAKDDRRRDFIERYLYALSRAMKEGCDVRGFYYWSLLDNFEWAEGYEMRFGLYEVNYETQERRLREGSKAYGEIIGRFSGEQA